jgi:hypothetical protein
VQMWAQSRRRCGRSPGADVGAVPAQYVGAAREQMWGQPGSRCGGSPGADVGAVPVKTWALLGQSVPQPRSRCGVQGAAGGRIRRKHVRQVTRLRLGAIACKPTTRLITSQHLQLPARGRCRRKNVLGANDTSNRIPTCCSCRSANAWVGGSMKCALRSRSALSVQLPWAPADAMRRYGCWLQSAASARWTTSTASSTLTGRQART